MNIAELFYSKELKEIIADLRSKDDLNEDALMRFDNYVLGRLKVISVVILVMSLFLFLPNVGLTIYLIILLLSLFLLFNTKHDISQLSNKLSHLYNYGDFVVGLCESYGRGYHAANFVIVVSFVLNEQKLRSKLKSKDSFWKNKKIKKGDSILIAYDPKNPDNNAPFIPSLADILYLT